MSAKSKGGAPLGNHNAEKGKRWRDAIERVLAKRHNGNLDVALDELAEKFLDTVEEMTVATEKRGPSVAGFVELADRIEGKTAQALIVAGDKDQPLTLHHKIG